LTVDKIIAMKTVCSFFGPLGRMRGNAQCNGCPLGGSKRWS